MKTYVSALFHVKNRVSRVVELRLHTDAMAEKRCISIGLQVVEYITEMGGYSKWLD